MGISIKWDNPDKTLIILEFNSQWTWDDLYRVTDEMHRMLDTVDHPVDTITILTRSRGLPGGFVGHASRLASRSHRNSRIGVIVGANKLVEMAVEIARKVHSSAARNLVFAQSLDQAYAIIAASRDLVENNTWPAD